MMMKVGVEYLCVNVYKFGKRVVCVYHVPIASSLIEVEDGKIIRER